MPCTVHFSDLTYGDFFKPVLGLYPDLLNQINLDFKNYIDSDRMVLPEYFGCDVAYVKQEAAIKQGLMHIHLAIPPVTFPKNKPKSDRKCPRDPATDAALVYAQGLYDEDQYVLIAILYPGAHGKANERWIMLKLIEAAKRFRDKY